MCLLAKPFNHVYTVTSFKKSEIKLGIMFAKLNVDFSLYLINS